MILSAHGGIITVGSAVMVDLVIVRHSKTPWNLAGRVQGRSDIPLAPESEEATREAGKRLRPLPDIAFCSPLIRAKRTAELLLEGSGVEIRTDDRLVERNFGEYEGKTYDELGLPDHTELFYALGETKGAESSESVFSRVRSFLTDIAASFDGKRVLVVSHGVCISYLIYALNHDKWDPADYDISYIKNLDFIEKKLIKAD